MTAKGTLPSRRTESWPLIHRTEPLPVASSLLKLETSMHEYTELITQSVFSMDQDLTREFEIRLAESSTLAFRVAYSVLRNSENAEDVAQEAFAKAYTHFRSLRDRERFRSWLVRMTWRMAINRLRSDRRRSAREAVPAETSSNPTPVQNVMAAERAALLWRAIDALPDKLRLVVVLAGIEEHDIRDVAALLGLPQGTVKSRLFVARQRMKEFMQ
jgi:RNA polymerase sigma-70 factor (ECF subfamily)